MTSTSASPVGEAPAAVPPPRRTLWSRWAPALAFFGPAFFLLAIWYVYPTIATVVRSFFSNTGNQFVWFDNYKEIFTDDVILTAVKNNAIWVLIVPAAVTAFGLVFAVLTERINWAVAFKFAVFAPLAISLFAAGVIWRAAMFDKDPAIGSINHVAGIVRDAFSGDSGIVTNANPSTPDLEGSIGKGYTLNSQLRAGDTGLLGLTAIPPDEVPKDGKQAVQPEPLQGGIAGVVWRDFKPGGGKAGEVEQGEVGMPGATVDLLSSSGDKVSSTKAAADGSFSFPDVGGGAYQLRVSSSTFAAPFGGIDWLGPSLITPALIIAYLWTAAGFAMVIIGAGLAAIPRDGAAPRARALGRLHHADHRRAEGLRHRAGDCPRLDAKRRDRARIRDVAQVVLGREPVRRRRGSRGLHLHPRDPDPDPEHSAVPKGGGRLVATAAAEARAEAPVRGESFAGKTVRFVAKTPVHIFLLVV